MFSIDTILNFSVGKAKCKREQTARITNWHFYSSGTYILIKHIFYEVTINATYVGKA